MFEYWWITVRRLICQIVDASIFSYHSLHLPHWLCNRYEAIFSENSAFRPLTCVFYPVTAMTRHKIAGCERSPSVNVCTAKVKLEIWQYREIRADWTHNRLIKLPVHDGQQSNSMYFALSTTISQEMFTFCIPVLNPTTQAGIEKQTELDESFQL